LQADPEPIATELEEKLNLGDKEKKAEEEEGEGGEKAAPPGHSYPEPPAVVEVSSHSSHASHSPAPVVEAEPEDADPRQHLNVVFIGHVGTDSDILFQFFVSEDFLA